MTTRRWNLIGTCWLLFVAAVSWPRATLAAQASSLGGDTSGQTHTGQLSPRGLWYSMRGAGPTIVLIHGSNLDSRVMEPLADSLARDHRVVLVDLRFHGRSKDDGGAFSFAQDLASVMEAAGIRKAILLGHSLGADVALAAALMHPERVDGLILVSPSIRGVPQTRPIERLGAVAEAVRAGDMRKAGEALAKSPPLQLMQDSSRAVALRQIVGENVALFLVNPSRAIAAPPTLDRLAELATIPMLAVVGGADPTNADAAADALRARVPRTSVVTLPGCGHILPFDCIGPLVGAIRSKPPFR